MLVMDFIIFFLILSFLVFSSFSFFVFIKWEDERKNFIKVIFR